MKDRSCSVVDSIDCQAPPEYGNEARDLVECWGCGDDVCRSCSSVIPYRYQRRTLRIRMCFRCQDDRKVGRAAPLTSRVR